MYSYTCTVVEGQTVCIKRPGDSCASASCKSFLLILVHFVNHFIIGYLADLGVKVKVFLSLLPKLTTGSDREDGGGGEAGGIGEVTATRNFHVKPYCVK